MKKMLLMLILSLPAWSKDLSGFKITDMDKGSTYEMLGLQKGDTIQKLDGKSLKSWNDIKNALIKKKKGEILKLEIIRNGKNEVIYQKIEK